ncbi:hypothetical protein V7654_22575 [Bacillus sp. JJ1609]|uniref:hypothetical protein n=1 Tax=Bacillus sp. JJ1609 TaxID=3122977 RepID=UPI003000EC8C
MIVAVTGIELWLTGNISRPTGIKCGLTGIIFLPTGIPVFKTELLRKNRSTVFTVYLSQLTFRYEPFRTLPNLFGGFHVLN